MQKVIFHRAVDLEQQSPNLGLLEPGVGRFLASTVQPAAEPGSVGGGSLDGLPILSQSATRRSAAEEKSALTHGQSWELLMRETHHECWVCLG